jgi:hypothetical protein
MAENQRNEPSITHSFPAEKCPAAAKGSFLRPGHRNFAEKGVYYKKSFRCSGCGEAARYDPIRKLKNNVSSDHGQSEAEAILNRDSEKEDQPCPTL